MTDDVLISVERGVGRLRLNRPKAIHALTTRMCDAMSEALLKWRSDPDVEVVLIDHAEGRGFCAGGDVVMLARSGNTDAEEAKRFLGLDGTEDDGEDDQDGEDGDQRLYEEEAHGGSASRGAGALRSPV